MESLATINNTLLFGSVEIPDQDLLYISLERDIPTSYSLAQTITQFTDENGNKKIKTEFPPPPEPSTIYVWAKIQKGDEPEPLGYFPKYYKMTPTQRYKYIMWLTDVTQDIEPGYLFVYYYGLERQLLEGNFDKAFDRIVFLREYHKNASFRKYSESALIHSCIIKNRLDRLVDLHEKTELSNFRNTQILLAHKFKLNLSATNILELFFKAINLARKAVRENRELILRFTEEVLNEKYPDGFPLYNYNITNTKTCSEERFANHSFDREFRWIDVTNFYSHELLMNDIGAIFKEAYERYKEFNLSEKVEYLSSLTKEEIDKLEIERKTKKYEALLKKRAINKSEFEVLLKSIQS